MFTRLHPGGGAANFDSILIIALFIAFLAELPLPNVVATTDAADVNLSYGTLR
jgi:hypothetical protein